MASNELVSLEQVQARAISQDTERQVAMDNVTLYINRIEQQIRNAEKQLTEMIPVIQKAVNEAAKKEAAATEADSQAACKKLAASYQDVVAFLDKKGFKTVKLRVNVNSTTKDGHSLTVCLDQKSEDHYRNSEIYLGTDENKKTIMVPVSKAVLAAQAEHKAMREKLAEAQKKLLEVKCQAQDIGRHEREGKALVIKAERQRTTEGKAMVAMVETAAEDRCLDMNKYTEALAKSLKALPGR